MRPLARLTRALRDPREESEKGTALVEFSLVLGLLLMLCLGAFEYGMAFRDWLSVTMGAREGGRVAASAGTYPNADCIILEASAGALQGFDSGQVVQVQIYQSSSTGSYPGTNSALTRRYRPGIAGEPGLIACTGGSLWIPLHLGNAWDPNDRDNTGDNADWIGVRIIFNHNWYTGFLWWNGSTTFTDDAVFRLEPPPPD